MKTILIPTNMSPEMNNTLKYAIRLGVVYGSKLIFYIANESRELAIEEVAASYISDIYKELSVSSTKSGYEITIESGYYDNDKVKKAVDNLNIDLVIIGSSQESYNTTFFGSQISDLIADLECSVLSIPSGHAKLVLDRIGFATELIDFHNKVKEIVPLARKFGASIEACHVYPVFPQEVDIAKYDIKHALLQVRTENDYPKIDLHFVKTPFNNEPVRGIREFIQLYKPDMLVMCHKPRGIFDILTMDASATEAVVKISPIPILALNCTKSCKLD